MADPHSVVESSLLDVDELAERLNISVRHVRRLVAERRVPYLKVGHLLRFEPAAIEAWVEGLTACTGTVEGPQVTMAIKSRSRRRSAGAA